MLRSCWEGARGLTFFLYVIVELPCFFSSLMLLKERCMKLPCFRLLSFMGHLLTTSIFFTISLTDNSSTYNLIWSFSSVLFLSLIFKSSSSAGNFVSIKDYLNFLDSFLVGLKVLHDKFFVVIKFMDEIGQVVWFFHFVDDCFCYGIKCMQVAFVTEEVPWLVNLNEFRKIYFLLVNDSIIVFKNSSAMLFLFISLVLKKFLLFNINKQAIF